MQKKVFVAVPHHRPEGAHVLGAISEGLAFASEILGLRFEYLRLAHQEDLPRPPDALNTLLSGADLVIADLGDSNSNVLFEIGFAQSLGKPLIILAEDSSQIPFHLRQSIVLLYQSSAPQIGLARRIADAAFDIFAKEQSPELTHLQSKRPKRHKLFISYSHADREFLDRIVVHLRPLERGRLIDYWADTKINPGDKWREEIRKALDEASAALLLISADFMASNFIIENELPPLLTAAEKEGTQIIPLIVKPSRFVREPRLSDFQAINNPDVPLLKMNEVEREEVYARLAEKIEIILRRPAER